MFVGCPAAPLPPILGVIIEGDPTVQAYLVGLNITLSDMAMGEELKLNATSSKLLNSLSLFYNPMTNNFSLVVDRAEVSEGDMVQVNVTLTIIDMMMVVMDECVFTVDVTYVTAGLCDHTQLPLLPVSTILQSIHLTINISLDQVSKFW